MKTLSLPNPSGKPTRREMQVVVQTMLREIQTVTTDMLQDIGDAAPLTAATMRAEISHLSGIAFTLTRCLSNGDVEATHQIINGDDVEGEALRMAI